MEIVVKAVIDRNNISSIHSAAKRKVGLGA
jgi:hypothetical protein